MISNLFQPQKCLHVLHDLHVRSARKPLMTASGGNSDIQLLENVNWRNL